MILVLSLHSTLLFTDKNHSKNQMFLWVKEVPVLMLSSRYKPVFHCLEVPPCSLPEWFGQFTQGWSVPFLLKNSLLCLPLKKPYPVLRKVLQKCTQLIIQCSPSGCVVISFCQCSRNREAKMVCCNHHHPAQVICASWGTGPSWCCAWPDAPQSRKNNAECKSCSHLHDNRYFFDNGSLHKWVPESAAA